jgi:hypothetical protein
MKRLSHVVGRALVLGLIWILMGAPGALAADEPSKQPAAPPGDAQERGIQRGTFGGPVGPATKMPSTATTGFYCIKSKNKCYCDRTTHGDCDLMQALVCAGPLVNTHIDAAECTAIRPK